MEYIKMNFIKVTIAGGGKKEVLIRIKDIESVEKATVNPEWTVINFYNKERTGIAIEESFTEIGKLLN